MPDDAWVMATCISLLPLSAILRGSCIFVHVCEKTAICQSCLWQQVAKRAEQAQLLVIINVI